MAKKRRKKGEEPIVIGQIVKVLRPAYLKPARVRKNDCRHTCLTWLKGTPKKRLPDGDYKEAEEPDLMVHPGTESNTDESNLTTRHYDKLRYRSYKTNCTFRVDAYVRHDCVDGACVETIVQGAELYGVGPDTEGEDLDPEIYLASPPNPQTLLALYLNINDEDNLANPKFFPIPMGVEVRTVEVLFHPGQMVSMAAYMPGFGEEPLDFTIQPEGLIDCGTWPQGNWGP